MKNIQKILHPLAKEFSLTKCGFDHSPVDDFIRSQWQKNSRSIIYLIYRWVIGLFFLGVLVASLIVWFWGGKYFLYFTNWGIIMCTITNMMGALLVTIWYFHPKYSQKIQNYTGGDPTDLSIRIYWALHTTTLAHSLVVTIIYWSLLFPAHRENGAAMDIMNIFVHAFNSILMVLDILIVAFPVRIFHIFLPIIFGTVYAIFTVIYYFAGGTSPLGERFIYPILDWSKPGLSTGVVAAILALYAILSLILFFLYKLRTFIYSKCCNTSSSYDFKDYPIPGKDVEIPRTSI